MKSFLAKCGAAVLGVLNGFDRLCFRGTLRNLAYPQGLQHYLWAKRIPFKDFDRHSKKVTQQVVEASLRHAQETAREIRYLNYAEARQEHVYHYQIHPVVGFMHARIQTWFPFRIYVCLNGREWLARQLDQAGLTYQRRDNGFTWIEDLAQAPHV